MSKKTSNCVPNRDEFTKFYIPFVLNIISKYGSIENYLMQNPKVAIFISSKNLNRSEEHLNNWLEKQFDIPTIEAQSSRNKFLDLCNQISHDNTELSGHVEENDHT